MTDLEFREQVVAGLARIEAVQAGYCRDMTEIRLTLYGAEGRTGLVEDVSRIKSGQAWWNRLMTVAQGLLAAGLAALGMQK